MRFILTIILLFSAASAHADDRIYRAITEPQEWLNVSRPLTSDDLKGRIILLDFWTYCCVNCQQIMPDLKYLEEKFGDKLLVIGVHSAKFNAEKDKENIRAAVLRFDLHHPVVNDAQFSVWRAFGARAWPTFVLIAPDGNIASTLNGEGNRTALEQQIQKILDTTLPTNTSALPIRLEKSIAAPSLLSFPEKLEHVESLGGTQALFVSDSGHNRVIGIKLAADGKSGKVFTTAGNGQATLKDGTLDAASFNHPEGLFYDNGTLYVADTRNHAIRKIDFTQGNVSTVAGIGTRGPVLGGTDLKAKETALATPMDVIAYPDADTLAIANTGTHQLLKLNLKSGTLDVLAGSGKEFIDDGPLPENSLSQPSGLAVRGGRLYFVDAETSSLRMLKDGSVSTLIGTGLFDFGWVDGLRTEALFQHPQGVFVDDNQMYVADTFNHAIRAYDPAKGTVSTIAGSPERGFKDGMLEFARFNEPTDVQRAGNLLYIADTNNHAIRVLDLHNNTVSTLKITEPARPEMPSATPNKDTPAYPEELPNLLVDPTLPDHLSSNAKIHLALPKGWKINHDAPSDLRIYAVDGKRAKLAHSFTLEELRKGTIALPKLQTNFAYLLQGSLYYCEEKSGSACLIRSVHHLFQLNPKGASILNITLGK